MAKKQKQETMTCQQICNHLKLAPNGRFFVEHKYGKEAMKEGDWVKMLTKDRLLP